MQRITVVKTHNKSQQETRERFAHRFRLFSRVNTTAYAMSAMTKLKDLGVAELMLSASEGGADLSTIHKEMHQLGKQVKDMREHHRKRVIVDTLERINHQHKVDLQFAYPVMNLAATNQSHLKKKKLSLSKITEKMTRAIDNLEAKYRNTKSAARKEIIHQNKNDTIAKYHQEIALYENEIFNRENMQGLLNQITMPIRLKDFMAAVNKISMNDKRQLVTLLTNQEQLFSSRELVAAPYELMYVYDGKHDDLVVGIRSRYDHDHPHPTLMGGVEPEVLVAGTIDLKLEGETIMMSGIGIDSGHFKPQADSLECIMRYVHAEMNPRYYDRVIMHTMENNMRTPRLAIR